MKVPYTRTESGRIVLFPDDPDLRQVWPDPTSERLGRARWRAAYTPGSVDREDLLQLCAVFDAYHHLVAGTAGTEHAVRSLRALRRACLDARGKAGGDR